METDVNEQVRVDLRPTIGQFRRSPGMWGSDGSYDDALVFLAGLDVATGGQLFAGIDPWMRQRLGLSNFANTHWSGLLIVDLEKGAPVPKERREALFELVDEYLSGTGATFDVRRSDR